MSFLRSIRAFYLSLLQFFDDVHAIRTMAQRYVRGPNDIRDKVYPSCKDFKESAAYKNLKK